MNFRCQFTIKITNNPNNAKSHLTPYGKIYQSSANLGNAIDFFVGVAVNAVTPGGSVKVALGSNFFMPMEELKLFAAVMKIWPVLSTYVYAAWKNGKPRT